MMSILITKWATLIVAKTRKQSLFNQGLAGNDKVFISMLFEIAIILLICYLPGVNKFFGARPIAFPHLLVPSLTYVIVILLYDEIRKVFVRAGMVK